MCMFSKFKYKKLFSFFPENITITMNHLNFRQQEQYLTMQTQMNRIRSQILRNEDTENRLRNHYREKEWELNQIYIRLGLTPTL